MGRLQMIFSGAYVKGKGYGAGKKIKVTPAGTKGQKCGKWAGGGEALPRRKRKKRIYRIRKGRAA